jgi:rRNA maturation RNase YbeY
MPNNTIDIIFFSEEIEFTPPNSEKIQQWILQTIESENHQLEELNYIFCNDDYLLKMNLEYLDHDTLTDIITFDNSEEEGKIAGDIFISIERVQENAQIYEVDFENELQRVMIHGVLHLLGYADKGEENERLMREKEDFYIQRFSNYS